MAEKKSINEKAALQHLMDLLSMEGLSGEEGKVAAAIRKKAKAAGVKASLVRHDNAHKRVPMDAEIGNLIIKLPGTIKAPRRLLMGHMDTVPLCRGADPVRKGNRIVAKGKTGLGADNRTACACLVTVLETIMTNNIPHPPLTFLFTFAEEIGLWGARMVKKSDLGNPSLGVNIDSGPAEEIITGAIGADRWEVDVIGISSHAGVHPDHGVSASLITSRAIADVAGKGFFGKIRKGKYRGTSNVGIIRGGEATNQVTDRVFVKGESRSHDRKFVDQITRVYKTSFEKAAQSVKNHKGKQGKIKFKADSDYQAFKMAASDPVVRFARKTARSLGLAHKLRSIDGGLDANYLNAKGIPTVTVGAGQHGPHTVDEYVDIQEYLDGCRYVLALATMEF